MFGQDFDNSSSGTEHIPEIETGSMRLQGMT